MYVCVTHLFQPILTLISQARLCYTPAHKRQSKRFQSQLFDLLSRSRLSGKLFKVRHPHPQPPETQRNPSTSLIPQPSSQARALSTMRRRRSILPLVQILFLLPLIHAQEHIRPTRDITKVGPLSNNANDPQTSPARIALLHMVNNVWFFQELAEITLRNKRRYAIRHNYEVITHTPHETSGLLRRTDDCEGEGVLKRDGECFEKGNDFQLDKRAPTFGKIKLALDACVGRKDYWLLWTDADAMLVNHTVPLTDIVDDAYDIIVAHDWFMVNAGVMLLRCSEFNIAFLNKVYDARQYDKALALDQSAFNDFFTKDKEVKDRVKIVPKHHINVYTEEYRPGDFILHFAGKLYEATPWGIGDIARQFDVLSRIDDVNKIAHFFNTRYLLNYFSGTCVMGDPKKDPNRDCDPYDERRMKLPEPLGAFSSPNRYRQLEYRNPRIKNWKDPYDVPGATDVKVRRSNNYTPK